MDERKGNAIYNFVFGGYIVTDISFKVQMKQNNFLIDVQREWDCCKVRIFPILTDLIMCVPCPTTMNTEHERKRNVKTIEFSFVWVVKDKQYKTNLKLKNKFSDVLPCIPSTHLCK